MTRPLVTIPNHIPLWPLIIVSVVLGLAPFTPRPHLVEKLQMLINGQLHRLIDIFDLLMHSLPLMLLALKLVVRRQDANR